MRVYKPSFSSQRARILEQRRQAAREQQLAVKRQSAFPTKKRPGIGAPSSLYNARMGGVESKFIDTTGSVTTLSTTPQIILLNGVATGTDYNTRVGREITMSSLYFRFQFASTVNAFLRFMIVYDKQCNGAAPAITDILSAITFVSANNLNNKDRFVTIMDKTVAFDTARQLYMFQKKYRKLNTVTQFTGTGATVGSIGTGSVYLIVFSQNDTPSFAFNSRIRFSDQ